MVVKKLSVALESEVADAAAAAAEAHGQSLSAWLSEAARNQLRIERGLAAVRDWEAEHGQLSDDEHAAADAIVETLLGREPDPRSA